MREKKERIFIAVLLAVFLTLLMPWTACADKQTRQFCFFDTDHFSANEPGKRQQALINMLQTVGADCVVLAGIRDAAALKKITNELPQYMFSRLVNGQDHERRLAIIAKDVPAAYKSITDLSFNIRDRQKKMHQRLIKRGIIHAVFESGDYRLHLFGAHLYERQKHEQFNHTDIRRYEARALRKYINALLKKEPKANILLLANLNDDCGKSPVKDIYNRRFGIKKRLFDLRPLDSIRTSWTCFNQNADAYERLDFAICTSWLIPEVDFADNGIYQVAGWQRFFRHRPIWVTVDFADREVWPKMQLANLFPNTVYEGVAGSKHFEKQKKVGKSRKRNSPTKK